MRMWLTDPEMMCSKHLLGEHSELHMLVNCVFDLDKIATRHNELSKEILRRGYNHNSPLNRNMPILKIDKEESLKELLRRCNHCKEVKKNERRNKLSKGQQL